MQRSALDTRWPLLLRVSALVCCACEGGQTFIGHHRLAAGGTGEELGSAGASCGWSGTDGLVAEWRANGDTSNEVTCSPFDAAPAHTIAYGPSREGEAWQFRSTNVDGADPDFIDVRQTQPVTLGNITIDAWVRQLSFNDYPNSNRIVFSTSYSPFAQRSPGEAQLYLHENKTYFAWFKTGSGNVLERDWRGCDFPSLGPPETLAPLDTWLRLTVTYDGRELRCFLNGELESAAPLPEREAPTSTFAPVIGPNYPGDVDALRIFNRALTPEEVRAAWPKGP